MAKCRLAAFSGFAHHFTCPAPIARCADQPMAEKTGSWRLRGFRSVKKGGSRKVYKQETMIQIYEYVFLRFLDLL